MAGLAVLAGTCAKVAGHRAFARLVRRDVEALYARAAPARTGVVTEDMLADLPGPSAATSTTPGWWASRSPGPSSSARKAGCGPRLGQAGAAAVILAGHRDLGTAVLARHRPASGSTRLLEGPAGLVIQLERWVALSWIGGLTLAALIFGMVARSAAGAHVGATVQQQVARLGGHQGGATAAWIGYEFVYRAALIAFAAAAQISGVRSEEADGHLDNLLARRLDRGTWLAGRLGFAVALILAAGLATGLGGWIGVAGPSGTGFAAMMQAGLNIAVPALFILGVGTLLYGLLPLLAAPILYLVILWSFLIEIIGSSITSNHWLLDTAVLTHLGPVPATSLNWTAIGWLTGLALITALAGLAALRHRDLAAA